MKRSTLYLGFAVAVVSAMVAACSSGGTASDTDESSNGSVTNSVTDPSGDSGDSGDSSGDSGAADPSEAEGDADNAAAEFYADNRITIEVGFSAGGVYGLVSELVAKYLPKHLDGEPSIVVDYRPGAVSLVDANAVFNTDPQDGTIIGSVHEGITTQQALGVPQVKFDVNEFQWVGSAMKSFIACAASSDLGINTLQDAIDRDEPLIMAAGAPGAANHDGAKLLKDLVGAKFKLVTGYEGAGPIALAIKRGEADGTCAGYATFEGAAYKQLIDAGTIKLFTVFGDVPEDLAEVSDVSRAEDMVEGDDLAVMDLLSRPFSMSRPFVMGPEVPADRVEYLRQAFAELANDEEFLAAGSEAGLDLQIRDGAEVQSLVEKLMDNASGDTATRLADILGIQN